ncbi:unnamed protein product, partial [Medioppia subpectinata]
MMFTRLYDMKFGSNRHFYWQNIGPSFIISSPLTPHYLSIRHATTQCSPSVELTLMAESGLLLWRTRVNKIIAKTEELVRSDIYYKINIHHNSDTVYTIRLTDISVTNLVLDNSVQTDKIEVYETNEVPENGTNFDGNNIIYVTADDRVYGCGDNYWGSLGLGHNQPVPDPQPIPELCNRGIQRFVNGWSFVLGITGSASVFSWGDNRCGQLGRKDIQSAKKGRKYYKPKQIPYFLATDVSAGSGHALVVNRYGQVLGWGANRHGQLGHNRAHVNTRPVLVNFFNNDKISAVYCYVSSSFAITMGGFVYSWGHNSNYRLGHDKMPNLSQPTMLTNMFSIKTVCCSQYMTYFLTNNGYMYFCGQYSGRVPGAEFRQIYPVLLQNCFEIQDMPRIDSDKSFPFITIMRDNRVFELMKTNEWIETQYKSFVDFYAHEWSITCNTVDVYEYELMANKLTKVTESYCDKTFEELDMVGLGGYGAVFKVRHRLEDRIYAIKRIQFTDKPFKEKMLNELKSLLNLRSEYVVSYYNSWQENDCLYIQTEYCSQSLEKVLGDKRLAFGRKTAAGNTMDSYEYFTSCEIFKEVLQCVQYLHELTPAVIHRDLKPANILISVNSGNGRFIKLCDFGLATVHDGLATDGKHTTGLGTSAFMAPEVLQSSHYNHKADIYSLSVTDLNHLCVQTMR